MSAPAKISEPGEYDLTLEEYHGDCCAGPSVSSSVLREVAICPAKAWAKSPLNPDRLPEETSDTFDFGKAAHDKLLFGDLPIERYFVLPGNFNGRTNEGKALKAQAIHEGQTIVKFRDMDKINAMVKAVRDHPYAWALFERGRAEKSLIWQDKATGLWLKARPDFLPDAGRFIPDYKTSANARPEDFCRDINKFGYHVQAALYVEGIRAVTDLDPQAFIFVVQEKKAPFVVQPYQLEAESFEYGRYKMHKAIELFADCLEKGVWPGYDYEAGENAMPAGVPRWAGIQMEDAIANGQYDHVKERMYGRAETETADPGQPGFLG